MIDGGGGHQKVDFFEPHPPYPPTKPHFWPTLWLKVDLLADLGGASHPLHPPGYGPEHNIVILLSFELFYIKEQEQVSKIRQEFLIGLCGE